MSSLYEERNNHKERSLYCKNTLPNSRELVAFLCVVPFACDDNDGEFSGDVNPFTARSTLSHINTLFNAILGTSNFSAASCKFISPFVTFSSADMKFGVAFSSILSYK